MKTENIQRAHEIYEAITSAQNDLRIIREYHEQSAGITSIKRHDLGMVYIPKRVHAAIIELIKTELRIQIEELEKEIKTL